MDKKLRKAILDILEENHTHSLSSGYNRELLADKISKNIEVKLGRELLEPRKMDNKEFIKMNKEKRIEALKKLRKERAGGDNK